MVGSRHGTRYLSASEFTTYCQYLKMPLSGFDAELQLYERENVVVPVARVITPAEFILYMESEGVVFPRPKAADRDKLRRLIDDMPKHSAKLRGKDLWHSFDREFEVGNQFLILPDPSEFVPWQDLCVWVDKDTDAERCVSNVDHYYHYWQAYQIYQIREHYPCFSHYSGMIRRFKEYAQTEYERAIADSHWPRADDISVSLGGFVRCFDALSFYVTLAKSERNRAFANVPRRGGYKQLEGAELKRLRRHMRYHAIFVMKRYFLSETDCFNFLVYLLNLRHDCEKSEHFKIASELRKDIRSLTEFMHLALGKSFDKIADELDTRDHYWERRWFLSLDRLASALRYTESALGRVLDKYNVLIPQQQITKLELASLVKFIDKRQLYIVPTTIHDTEKAYNEDEFFDITSFYIAMKNLATGLECFLREIAIVARRVNTAATLDALLQNLFASAKGATWYLTFATERSDKSKYPTPSVLGDLINNTRSVMADKSLERHPDGTIIKQFLIVYWVRNFTSHQYKISPEILYGEVRAAIFTAMYYAFLYSWRVAKQNKWVS
jgi:hypothetical protein